jgi:Protein of unknown function (DUF2937)
MEYTCTRHMRAAGSELQPQAGNWPPAARRANLLVWRPWWALWTTVEVRSVPILRGLLDRFLLVISVVAGGLVPGFIAQYRQRLGGRLDQAQLDLEPWQKLADQFYHGDIDKLIQYHLSSTDPTFHSEGGVIRALVASVHQLQSAVNALHASLLQQVAYLARHADPSLTRATFSDWVPTFALSSEGLVFAVAFALAVWLLFHALWWLVSRATRLLFGRPYARA